MGGELGTQQDEGLGPQLCQGDAVPLGQGVVFADDQAGTVPDKKGGVKGRLRHGKHHAAHVQNAGFHIGQDALGTVLPDMQLDIGVLAGKVGDQLAEKAGAGHIGKADVYVAGKEALVRMNGLFNLIIFGDDLGGLFVELLSLRCQMLLAALRIKELDAQLTLHLLDDLAEGRLRDIELFSRNGIIGGHRYLCKVF